MDKSRPSEDRQCGQTAECSIAALLCAMSEIKHRRETGKYNSPEGGTSISTRPPTASMSSLGGDPSASIDVDFITRASHEKNGILREASGGTGRPKADLRASVDSFDSKSDASNDESSSGVSESMPPSTRQNGSSGSDTSSGGSAPLKKRKSPQLGPQGGNNVKFQLTNKRKMAHRAVSSGYSSMTASTTTEGLSESDNEMQNSSMSCATFMSPAGTSNSSCTTGTGSSKKARPAMTHRELKPAPYFYYIDRSQDKDDDPLSPLSPPLCVPNFVIKLHAILIRKDLEDIIGWMPHGRSWKIVNPEEFEKQVLPHYFKQSSIASFHRQANGWGFRRMLKGPDKGSFYSENFLRGVPHLCKKMKRIGGAKTIESANISHEPNLWMISSEHRLPEGVPSSDDLNYIVLKTINGCVKEGGPKAKMPFIHQIQKGIARKAAAAARREDASLARAAAASSTLVKTSSGAESTQDEGSVPGRASTDASTGFAPMTIDTMSALAKALSQKVPEVTSSAATRPQESQGGACFNQSLQTLLSNQQKQQGAGTNFQSYLSQLQQLQASQQQQQYQQPSSLADLLSQLQRGTQTQPVAPVAAAAPTPSSSNIYELTAMASQAQFQQNRANKLEQLLKMFINPNQGNSQSQSQEASLNQVMNQQPPMSNFQQSAINVCQQRAPQMNNLQQQQQQQQQQQVPQVQMNQQHPIQNQFQQAFQSHFQVTTAQNQNHQGAPQGQLQYTAATQNQNQAQPQQQQSASIPIDTSSDYIRELVSQAIAAGIQLGAGNGRSSGQQAPQQQQHQHQNPNNNFGPWM